MAKEKIKVMVRGKMLELSSVAFEIARDYFGAQKVSELVSSKPIELSKPILIPKIPVKVEKPIELQKTELAAVLDKQYEGPMIELKEVVEPVKVVKKPATRKKK